MSLAEELNRLADLHARGSLSDEEFQRAKARAIDGHGAPPAPALDALNRLRRSTADRWIGGVCGGLARSTGAESWVWRLIFALLLLFGGTGLVVYILLWVFVPSE